MPPLLESGVGRIPLGPACRTDPLLPGVGSQRPWTLWGFWSQRCPVGLSWEGEGKRLRQSRVIVLLHYRECLVRGLHAAKFYCTGPAAPREGREGRSQYTAVPLHAVSGGTDCGQCLGGQTAGRGQGDSKVNLPPLPGPSQGTKESTTGSALLCGAQVGRRQASEPDRRK